MDQQHSVDPPAVPLEATVVAPVTAPDLDRASALWAECCAARPDMSVDDPYDVDHFGDSARLADELLGIVLAGGKRATAELVDAYREDGVDVPVAGSHWVACDSSGVPRAVLRTTEVRIGPVASATADFAAAEGEDDGTLESWHREHRRYWTRTREARGLTWSEDDDVVFEHLAVVWPPEFADDRDSGDAHLVP